MVFEISLHPCALDKKSLSIGRVNLVNRLGSMEINELTHSCLDIFVTSGIWTYDAFENTLRISYKL